MEIVKEIIPTEKRDELRFNDGGIDAKGRFWLAEIDKVAMAYGPNQLPASYGRAKGKLWRYDPDGSLHEMLDGGVVCGNGLGWSPDNKTCSSPLSILKIWKGEKLMMGIVYFHDSVAMVVYAFDFDLESGNISNKRLLIDRRDSFGEPDGMVVEYVSPLSLRLISYIKLIYWQHRRQPLDSNVRLQPCHGLFAPGRTLEGHHIHSSKPCMHNLGWKELGYYILGEREMEREEGNCW